MAKRANPTDPGQGIGADATQIWKFLCLRPGTWWNAQRLTNHWAPTFALQEMEAHLATLAKGRFLDADTSGWSVSYAVNTQCRALPGMDAFMQEAREAASRPMPITAPPRHDVMHGNPWRPSAMQQVPVRAGANDYRHCRSVGVRC